MRTTLFRSFFIAIVFSSIACTSPTPASRTTDIFREDQGDEQSGNSRRHPATADERLWTINMGGCTGHLISPDYMMTANHCSPSTGSRYSSGYASSTGGSRDITVTDVEEADGELDYAIMKIKWASGAYPKQQRFPPLIATKASDVSYGASDADGDEIFTVGFPGDKSGTWGATYSEGRLKDVEGTRLVYNMGIINGNSGGGVWKKSNKMLVSLTNGGPHVLGDSGWDTASASNANNWNNGPAMWNIYADSKILKDVFPNGKNRFATDDGTTESAKDIFVALGLGDRAATDSYVLHATVPAGIDQVYFCSTTKASDCRDGATGYTRTTKSKAIASRDHYEAAAATPLANDMTVSFVGLDAQGKTVVSRTVKFQPK